MNILNISTQRNLDKKISDYKNEARALMKQFKLNHSTSIDELLNTSPKYKKINLGQTGSNKKETVHNHF